MLNIDIKLILLLLITFILWKLYERIKELETLVLNSKPILRRNHK